MLPYPAVMTMEPLQATHSGRLIHTAAGMLLTCADYAPNIPLMQIALRLSTGRTQGTVEQYMRHFLHFEGFLNAAHVPWDASPELIRNVAFSYLKQHGGHVNYREDRWHVVTSDLEGGLASQTLRLRFEALRTIYKEAIRARLYSYAENPFAHTLSVTRNRTAPNEPPTWSGLTTGLRKKREPEQFMVFDTGYWMPKHLLDAANFPQLIIAAFEEAPLRDQCITRTLFRGGARLNEVTSLSMAGWNYAIGNRPAFHHTFKLRNKGSGTVPIKPVSVDEATGLLLRRYFMEERPAFDPMTPQFKAWCHDQGGLEGTPENYFAFLGATGRPPEEQAVFLNRLGKAYTANAYRKGAWRPRLAEAGIKARPHQARHAFVTLIMDGIAEAYRDDPEQRDLAREALGEYMFWAQPERTLHSYDHSRRDEHRLENIARTLESIKTAQMAKIVQVQSATAEARLSRLKRRNERINRKKTS